MLPSLRAGIPARGAAAASRGATDDKARAISSLLEYCRGAEEEDVVNTLRKKRQADIKRCGLPCRGAEREGFEPPEQLPVHRISSAARSTTPASFQKIYRTSAS